MPGNLRSDLAMTDFFRLYNDLSLIYEPGQISVTDLSLRLYTGTLLDAAQTFGNTLGDLQSALNFLAAAQQRRGSALVCIKLSDIMPPFKVALTAISLWSPFLLRTCTGMLQALLQKLETTEAAEFAKYRKLRNDQDEAWEAFDKTKVWPYSSGDCGVCFS